MRGFGQISKDGPLESIDLTEAAKTPLADGEIEIAVDHCSVCHSDLHLIDGDWGDVARPLVPGHEIIGRVVKSGASASTIAVGSIVGLGWQAGSCGTCSACLSERAHLCTGGKIRTCVGAGRIGGFAERVRCDARFAFEIPRGLDPTIAAPLLCAGLTVFSPLERLASAPTTAGGGKKMRVGVVGVGGLGHLAVRFASALGHEVIAFDPDASKKDLALSLGARELVSGDARSRPDNAVDLLLVTTHASLPWTEWMKVLDLEGTLCLIGVPNQPLTVSVDPLLDEQKRVTGSVIGSPQTMKRMLAFAAEKGIAPIIERMPMNQANASEALSRLRAGKARMRIILDRVTPAE